MNRYFIERFQDIRDALPSASPDTLAALRDELVALVEEIDERREGVNQAPSSPANVHNLSSAGNRP